MFARIAKSRDVGRRQKLLAMVAPAFANDNPFDRRLGGAMRRPRRQALLCRWRASPVTGKLECHWEIASADAGAAEEPEPRRAVPPSLATAAPSGVKPFVICEALVPGAASPTRVAAPVGWCLRVWCPAVIPVSHSLSRSANLTLLLTSRSD
jgi:hypothetical protein